MTVPAGWYPDPMGLPQLRWWDNHSWTEFTSAARSPLIMQQDGPSLAYADDDLPTRRSQREQNVRTDSAAQQPPMSKAELISTLRQLEPPKPQQIERNQPAPSSSDDGAAQQRAAQEAAQQQAAREAQARAQQQAAREAQIRAQQQAFAQHQAQQAEAEARAQQQRQGFAQEPFPGYGSPQQAEADPFAEFLQPEEPRAARSSVNYADAQGFPQADPAYAAPEQQFTRKPYVNPEYVQAQFVQPEYARPEYTRAQRRVTDRSQQIYTPAVWGMAMIPLAQMVIILLGVSSGAQAIPMWLVAAIWVVPYIAAIVLAVFDRQSLLRAGHRAPAHWAWACLSSIVYLIARSVATNREFGKGMTPVLVWASLTIVQALSVVAVPGILISSMPDVFKAEVEQSIAADAAIVGTALDVTCPSPAVQIGVQFTCVGETETGNQVEIKVSLQRANGWIDWRVDSQIWQSGALS